MNGTTMEPEGLDDPALLAEIEAEFAELTAEIQRISAMPSNAGPRKTALIEALRASWRERLEARGDRPEWRQRLDETVGRAVDRLLEDGLVENADGSIGFALRGDTIQSEGGPLLRGLLDGLSNMLSEKFPPPQPSNPGEPADPSAKAAPVNPLQGLLGGLGQALAGALKSAVAQVGAQTSIKLPTDAGDVKVVVTPAAPSAGTATSGKAVDIGTVDFRGEQEVKATFEVDNRKAGDAGAPGGTGAADPANNAGNAFFQQLFANLGQVVRQAVTPPPNPDAKAAPSPLGGLGQLFLGAIQKAFTPPPTGSTAPPSAETAATGGTPSDPEKDAATTSQDGEATEPKAPPASAQAGAAEASTDPTTSADGVPESLHVRIPQVDAERPADGAPAPALNVDIAGLLRHLLGNIKPPS